MSKNRSTTLKTWTFAYDGSEIIDWDLEDMAEVMAEVIAQKTTRAEWKEHVISGPGRIKDMDYNMEKIYEV